MERGIVFDIKRFAVHDGPGIRTSIFLKGCPLSCCWCHNPEGISPDIELWYNQKRCLRCERCITACRQQALQISSEKESFVKIDRERCQVSQHCCEICPSGALQAVGREMSLVEIMSELEKDRLFYDMSGGGVTLTGGEPLQQPDFCRSILQASKDVELNTALETSLYASREILESVIPYIDYMLVDIKLWDKESHRQYTGQDNTLILDNFRRLAEHHKQITVRIPLIKNITDLPENLRAIEDFVWSIDPDIPIEKLAYNPLAPSKYQKLGKDFLCD